MTLNSLKAAVAGQLRKGIREALAGVRPAETAEKQPTSALQKKTLKFKSPT